MYQYIPIDMPSNKNPKLITILSTTLQRKPGETLRRVAKDGEHLLIESGGFPVAVIIPVVDYKQLIEAPKRNLN
jgi:prevent-host-death family protein